MIKPDNQENRDQAAHIIAAGGVIAFRTDTFYGLGADPLNAAGLRRIRELKGREDNKPILILISDLSELECFISETAGLFDEVAHQRWPGPLTLIGLARNGLPSDLTAGTGSLGVRLPNDENVRELVRACGGGLTATSANLSGKPEASTAAEVEAYFPEGIDLIIDGGEVTVTEPSTVLDVSGTKARLIREGAIKKEELRDLLD